MPKFRLLACLVIVLPLVGGCKMFVAKTALRLAVGPEQAEKLDPVAQVRRKVLEGLRDGQTAPGREAPAPTTPP